MDQMAYLQSARRLLSWESVDGVPCKILVAVSGLALMLALVAPDPCCQAAKATTAGHDCHAGSLGLRAADSCMCAVCSTPPQMAAPRSNAPEMALGSAPVMTAVTSEPVPARRHPSTAPSVRPPLLIPLRI